MLPKADCSLRPVMTGSVTLVILSVLDAPLSLPPGGGKVGLRAIGLLALLKTIGARRMA